MKTKKKGLAAPQIPKNKKFVVLAALIMVSLAGAIAFGVSSVRGEAATVAFQGSKLYVNGVRLGMRGVNYNPVSIGTDQIDPAAATNDIPKIKALGANTVGTYMLGKSEWAQWSDITTGEQLYQTLMPAAEKANLYVVVGYFSNHTIDWTSTTRVAKVTSQYQELVNKAKSSPATLMYMIGNETFEKLPNDTQRAAYAKWIGDMANWTHANDPKHPVFYSDRGDMVGLRWLKVSAPNLDVYGVNNYSFTTAASLKSIVQGYANNWPGKPILVHEWGADSLNVGSNQEDLTMQSNAITQLASSVDTVTADATSPLVGGLNFEFTDEWRFVGGTGTQDKDAGWGCQSCGDGRANEDFWGLARAASAGQSALRTTKPAYAALLALWGGSPPIAAPAPAPSPAPAPAADTTAPNVSIVTPANGATVSGKITVVANASDNVGVTAVKFFVNGVQKRSDASPPYTYTWDTKKLQPGTHTLSAQGLDAAGNSTVSSVTVKK